MRTRRNARALLLLLLTCAAAGCASSTSAPPDVKPRGEPRPDRALVYLINPRHASLDGDSRTWIFDLKVPVCALYQNTYSYAYVNAGAHWLWNRTGGLGHAFRGRDAYVFEAGRTYYLAVSEDPGAWQALFLVPIDETTFESLVSTADFFPPNAADLRAARRMAEKAPDALPTLLPPPAPRAPEAREGCVPVPEGTPIPLTLLENANSHEVREGDALLFEVAADVELDGRVVVPRGFPVQGVVRRVMHPRVYGQPGFLEVEIPGLRLSGGGAVPLFGLMASVGGTNPLGGLAGTFLVAGSAAPSTTAGMVLGLLGLSGFFIIGGDPWLLAGTGTTAFVSAQSCAAPQPPSDEAARAANVVSGASAGPVLVPTSGRVEASSTVRLALDAVPRKVVVEAVGGTALPEPAMPSNVAMKEGECELTFPGWAILRWARLTGSSTTVPVLVGGTAADGSAFQATVPVVFQFEAQ